MALLRLFIFLTLATILPAVGLGQVEIDERTGSAATEFLRVKPGGVDQKASRSPAGTRRAIIVCGLAGDREYLIRLPSRFARSKTRSFSDLVSARRTSAFSLVAPKKLRSRKRLRQMDAQLVRKLLVKQRD